MAVVRLGLWVMSMVQLQGTLSNSCEIVRVLVRVSPPNHTAAPLWTSQTITYWMHFRSAAEPRAAQRYEMVW